MNQHTGAPVKIRENIYQFNEANANGPYVDAYLIVGEREALLVDALQTDTGLLEEIRKITDKPLSVFITHGHLDHAGAAVRELHEAGVPIYMSLKDFDLLKDMFDYGEARDWFIDLKPGRMFDLGGFRLHTLPLPGHSPGSVAALDYENELLFSGDGIGSGHFWMQLPGCLPLNQFQSVLEALYTETRKCPNLLVYPGHRNQSPVQLTGQYVRDTRFITNGLLNGTLKGEAASIPWQGGTMSFYQIGHGQMVSFCYDPENLFFGRPKPEIEAIKDKYTACRMRDGCRVMDYMLFTPKTAPGESYPLVLFLHGAGERGADPRVALANSGGWVFAEDGWQAQHPCFVAAPQVCENDWWTDDTYITLLAKLIGRLSMEGLPIDTARVYVTGLSMGGMGTWELILRYPSLFAAAMPICGAGDPVAVRAAKDVPVWAFHAVDDPVVPAFGALSEPFSGLVGTRWMVNALRGAGGRDVHYTEYPAGDLESRGLHAHASWIPAYDDTAAKEWLFAHKSTDCYEIQQVQPGFYWIDDRRGASIYLIEGRDRALVVDTGFCDTDFLGMIRSLTRLPFDLAVTHCHGDHMYHLDKFERYYMNERDRPLLDGSRLRETYSKKDYSRAALLPIEDGSVIDLGDCEIEVLTLPGHTPGSVVFLDKKHKIALTGDALGVWMHVPGATPLSEYRAGLQHFLTRMAAYPDYVMMGGHRKQEGGYFPYGDAYVPNDLQKVRDLIQLCDDVLQEEAPYEPFTLRTFGAPAYVCRQGQATIVFCADNLR